MKKTCFRCHTLKPLDAFYPHPQMRDGYLNKCKECTKADTRRRYYDKHVEMREYDRIRNRQPHRVAARLEYQKTPAGKRSHAKSIRLWRDRYPERRAASVAVTNALRSGAIFRLPCFICGTLATEAHHPDYNQPLDVIWLCTAHHKEVHKRNTKEP